MSYNMDFGLGNGDRPAPMEDLLVGAFGMEILATHPVTRDWIGRPVACVAICRRTLMVAGLRVMYGSMQAMDLIECLADAFLPKNPSKFGSDGDWPCEGAADRVHVDPRHYLKYAPLRRISKTIGFEIVRDRLAEPLVRDLAEHWSKDTGIEVDAVQDGLATHVRSWSEERPAGLISLPLDEIERSFRRWIVDVYNVTPIPGIERSPYDLWLDAAANFSPRPVSPEAPGDYFRPDAMREIGPHGVEWNGRAYWSEDLPSVSDDAFIPETFEVRESPSKSGIIELWDHFKRIWIELEPR